MEESKVLAATEISQHNTPDDCWVVIGGQVWDVTEFAPQHPGGAKSILKLQSN